MRRSFPRFGRFRAQPGEEGGVSAAIKAKEETRKKESLRCAVCGHPVTHPDQRTEIDGAFDHTFTNPHGFVFHIGCFSHAPGATARGPREREWSWFSSFTWRMADCRNCGGHLGWFFERVGGEEAFFGLIIDRLSGSE